MFLTNRREVLKSLVGFTLAGVPGFRGNEVFGGLGYSQATSENLISIHDLDTLIKNSDLENPLVLVDEDFDFVCFLSWRHVKPRQIVFFATEPEIVDQGPVRYRVLAEPYPYRNEQGIETLAIKVEEVTPKFI